MVGVKVANFWWHIVCENMFYRSMTVNPTSLTKHDQMSHRGRDGTSKLHGVKRFESMYIPSLNGLWQAESAKSYRVHSQAQVDYGCSKDFQSEEGDKERKNRNVSKGIHTYRGSIDFRLNVEFSPLDCCYRGKATPDPSIRSDAMGCFLPIHYFEAQETLNAGLNKT
jgi:hypothetical protein